MTSSRAAFINSDLNTTGTLGPSYFTSSYHFSRHLTRHKALLLLG
jgi:hypothetical protein